MKQGDISADSASGLGINVRDTRLGCRRTHRTARIICSVCGLRGPSQSGPEYVDVNDYDFDSDSASSLCCSSSSSSSSLELSGT